ncbi:MAG TPA: anti-sigma factor, partial [Vicinamibacterales bacterium]|nr:anti-sigma factor [Vicinamibacterales bacterium]
MYQPAPDLDHRLSELQAQIDRLSIALHLWRQTQDHLQPMERRLTQLTEQASEVLDHWTSTGERHAQAVSELEARLGDWQALETRLREEAAQRIGGLERTIEREWEALRQTHDEPVRQLREQAAALSESCVAAASTALTGFERAEARLTVLETDLQRQMTELSRDVQAIVAELRARGTLQPGGPSPTAAPWSLDGVVRLHNQLRESGESVDATTRAADVGPSRSIAPPPAAAPERAVLPFRAVPQLPEAPVAAGSERESVLAERVGSIERALTKDKTEIQAEIKHAGERSEQVGRSWRIAATILAVAAFVGAGAVALQLQRQLGVATTRITEAEREAQSARDTANRQVELSRDQAAKQIAEARSAAVQAQTIGNVLAAPDLVRYNLRASEPGSRASGQVLWSRSRGFVFSANRLAPVPSGSMYQIWLQTSAEPVSGGVFTP